MTSTHLRLHQQPTSYVSKTASSNTEKATVYKPANTQAPNTGTNEPDCRGNPYNGNKPYVLKSCETPDDVLQRFIQHNPTILKKFGLQADNPAHTAILKTYFDDHTTRTPGGNTFVVFHHMLQEMEAVHNDGTLLLTPEPPTITQDTATTTNPDVAAPPPTINNQPAEPPTAVVIETPTHAADTIDDAAQNPVVITDPEHPTPTTAPPTNNNITNNPAVSPTANVDNTNTAAKAYTHQTITIGNSVNGTPILMTIFTPEGYDLEGKGISTLIMGGFHGNENNAIDVSNQLDDHMRTNLNNYSNRLDGKAFAIIAEVNPDGIAQHTRRNANGVDLNRNFRTTSAAVQFGQMNPNSWNYPGQSPESEPETQAVRDAIAQYNPEKIISIHTGAMNKNLLMVDYDGSQSRQFATAIHNKNGYRLNTSSRANFGSLGTRYGREDNKKMVTLELPHHSKLSASKVFSDNLEAFITALAY